MSGKMKFEYTDHEEFKTIVESDGTYLPDIIDSFVRFLRGCGFSLDDLEIIRNEPACKCKSTCQVDCSCLDNYDNYCSEFGYTDEEEEND